MGMPVVKIKAVQALRKLEPKLARQCVVSATNKLMSRILTETKRAITQEYTIKKRDINYTTTRASSARPYGEIIAAARQRSLSRFKVQQSAKGVNFEMRRGTRSFIPGAFIAKTTNFSNNKSGRTYQGVFKREGEERYPIRSMYGFSEGLLLKSPWLRNVIRRVQKGEGQKLLLHEIKWRTERQVGK